MRLVGYLQRVGRREMCIKFCWKVCGRDYSEELYVDE